MHPFRQPVTVEPRVQPLQLLCDTLVARVDEREIHLLWYGAIEAAGEATGDILIRSAANTEPAKEDTA
jgi:hypothetical protein